MSSSETVDALPLWLQGHLLGLHACILRAADAESDEFHQAARSLLDLVTPAVSGPRRSFIQMPLSSLHILRAALEERPVGEALTALLPGVRTALDQLLGPDGASGVQHTARVWAAHALYATSDARRMLQLGGQISRGMRKSRWAEIAGDPALVGALAQALEDLRATGAATADRRSAVDTIVSVLGDGILTRQIELALQRWLHAWPLLVLPWSAHDVIAVSFPIGVDVEFDGRAGPPRILPERRAGGARMALNLGDWTHHLRRASDAAKILWKAKHGNCGPFRDEVKAATVKVDFTLVEALARALRNDISQGQPTLSLADSSAEAYLSQVILARLLGRAPPAFSVATGSIGDLKEPLNYMIGVPDGVAAKVRYVFESRAFERVALPTACAADRAVREQIQASRDERLQSAEVPYAADLHTMADALQVSGWRQFQYVRCPEIEWALHSQRSGRPALLPAFHPEVRRATELLAANDEPILRCEASPVALASALWHLNETTRLESSRPAPSLSWAFARLVPLERHDTFFWQLVGHLCGAPREDVTALLSITDRDRFADAVARLLTRFVPRGDRPSLRSPDLLVVIGADHLEERPTLNLESRPHDVLRTFEAIVARGLLDPSPEGKRLIGPARVVLLPATHEAVEVPGETSMPRLPGVLRSKLRDLATFEHGFARHVAGNFLRANGWKDIGDVGSAVLAPLVDAGALRSGQGQFHIPEPLRRELRAELDREPPALKARREYLAATALAPFVVQRDLVAMALDQAVLPHNVNEALQHLDADVWTDAAVPSPLRTSAQHARAHLLRHFAPLSWRVALEFDRSKRRDEWFDAAVALLDREGVDRAHPAHLVIAARAAASLARHPVGADGARRDPRALMAQAETWFRSALARAQAAFPAERPYNELQATTWLGAFLETRPDASVEELARLWQRTLELVRDGVSTDGANHSWFEAHADAMADHAGAAGIYALGLMRAQNRLKGLGAALLGRIDPTPFELPSDPEACARLLGWSHSSYHRDQGAARTHVCARWRAALDEVGGAGAAPVLRVSLDRLVAAPRRAR